ncbi:MAG: XamI family restriction endonuclease [Solirubrobacterales bacterium]
MIQPPRWTDEQLAADSQASIRLFIEARSSESVDGYSTIFEDKLGVVEELFEQTRDLELLSEQAVEVLSKPSFLEAVRYLAGPPISSDDLKVVANVGSLSAKRIKQHPEIAKTLVETVFLGLDRGRFPWLGENREVGEEERKAAALATAALLATRRVEANRRSKAKREQENLVMERLESVGFQKVETREVKTLKDAPEPGEFCGESVVGTRKADIVVGLWDGRTLLLECKVSNSATNSVKRLNNDAEAKAGIWAKKFGDQGVVPSAMLSGVFKTRNLEQAQSNGLTLWWAHALHLLTDWIESTRP